MACIFEVFRPQFWLCFFFFWLKLFTATALELDKVQGTHPVSSQGIGGLLAFGGVPSNSHDCWLFYYGTHQHLGEGFSELFPNRQAN